MGKINILNDSGTNKLSMEFTGTSDKTLDVEQIPQLNTANTFTNPISIYQGTQGQKRSIDVLVTGGINDGYYDGISFWQGAIGTGAHLGQIRVPYTNSGIGEFEWWGRQQLESSGSPYLKIDKYGRVTKPFQPSFSCYKSGSQYYPNVTDGNNSANVTLSGWVALFNTGNSFNTTTGVFTAPVAGKYKFCVNLMISGQRTDNDQQTRWYKNGSYVSGSNHVYSATYAQIVVEDIIDLAVGDTVECKIYGNGTKGAYVYTDRYSHISGYLIG